MAGSGPVTPNKAKDPGIRTSDDELPAFPGEELYAHFVSVWKEQAEAWLAKKHLLNVAQG